MFKRLNVKEWRQFSDVDIVFHEHLTVLTGANGAGKTTILNLLSKSTGGIHNLLAHVKRMKEVSLNILIA